MDQSCEISLAQISLLKKCMHAHTHQDVSHKRTGKCQRKRGERKKRMDTWMQNRAGKNRGKADWEGMRQRGSQCAVLHLEEERGRGGGERAKRRVRKWERWKESESVREGVRERGECKAQRGKAPVWWESGLQCGAFGCELLSSNQSLPVPWTETVVCESGYCVLPALGGCCCCFPA